MNLDEALSLIEDIELSFKECETTENTVTDFPKLHIMESFQPFTAGYSLWIKKALLDKTAFFYLRSTIKRKGLCIISLSEKYWMIYNSKA